MRMGRVDIRGFGGTGTQIKADFKEVEGGCFLTGARERGLYGSKAPA